jgi:hypothetical protein
MTETKLPWDGMSESTKRRVDLLTSHNVYWISDTEGNYGLYIQSETKFESVQLSINLKNIEVIKRNSLSDKGELILFLYRKEDAQIFHRICEDLIATIDQCALDSEMINSVEIRLNRWQDLLRSASSQNMSIELQMGLFSEMMFLKEQLIKRVGIEQAVISWVGPEFDKQDFLLENAVIEIKSYRTSRGQLVNISSVQQLYSEKHPLYLVSYGLTRTNENGLSVDDLVKEIFGIIGASSKISELFSLKLIDYGFIPELQTESYSSFIVDSCKFFSVQEDFPRVPLSIPSEIIKLNYTLDLSKCEKFEINIDVGF